MDHSPVSTGDNEQQRLIRFIGQQPLNFREDCFRCKPLAERAFQAPYGKFSVERPSPQRSKRWLVTKRPANVEQRPTGYQGLIDVAFFRPSDRVEPK